VVTLFCQQL